MGMVDAYFILYWGFGISKGRYCRYNMYVGSCSGINLSRKNVVRKFLPRGSFNDILLSKISHNRKIPRLMKNKWFRLLFVVVLMGAFAVQLTFAWGNMVQVGQVFVRMILITTGLSLILGVVYSHRAWCVVCPMGTMASWVTKAGNDSKSKNVTFHKEKCVSCNLCTKSCPMEIDVLKFRSNGEVTHPDCLKCSECVIKCPKGALEI